MTFFYQMGLFQVRQIPIEFVGSRDLPQVVGTPGAADELERRLQKLVQPFVDKKVWEVNLNNLRASIIKDEWVKDVYISRMLPSRIKVLVEPQKPVLVLVSPKKEFLPISEDGSLMSALPAGRAPDVPILRGKQYLLNKEMRLSAVQFVSRLPQEGALKSSNVSEMAWVKDRGFQLFLIHPRVEVLLGGDDLELKTSRVNQVLKYLELHRLKGYEVDASFSKKVLVRLRSAP